MCQILHNLMGISKEMGRARKKKLPTESEKQQVLSLVEQAEGTVSPLIHWDNWTIGGGVPKK